MKQSITSLNQKSLIHLKRFDKEIPPDEVMDKIKYCIVIDGIVDNLV